MNSDAPQGDTLPHDLRLPGKVFVQSTRQRTLEMLADEIFRFAMQRVRTSGVFHLALSGGSTPQALFRLLVIDPRYRAIPWDACHIWIVDERVVPFEDDRSNYRMMRETLLEHIPIIEAQVHPMRVDRDDADQHYELALRRVLRESTDEERLDMVLLGMGSDGHTASLFPNTDALDEEECWVVFNDGPTVAEPRPRLTLTYPAINAARHIAILVTGESKRATLQHVSLNRNNYRRFPIIGIEPRFNDTLLHWHLDAEAAGIKP